MALGLVASEVKDQANGGDNSVWFCVRGEGNRYVMVCIYECKNTLFYLLVHIHFEYVHVYCTCINAY